MKIIYVWIEKYRKIQKKEMIFNKNYFINFRYDTMSLSVQKNTESVDEFIFGNKVNVTAIVGNNGVGKSTVLDFIRELIFNNKGLTQNAKGFIIWEENDELHMYSFMDQEIHVTPNIIEEKYFYLYMEFGLLYYSDSLDLKDYNNMFDDGEDYIEPIPDRNWHQYNISTTYLLRKNQDSVLRYFHDDIKKQIELYKEIKDCAEDIIPFSLPQTLSLHINHLEPLIFNNVLDDNLSSYEYNGVGHHGENNTESYTIGLLKKIVEINSLISNTYTLLSVEQLIQWDIFLVYLYNQLANRKEIYETMDDYSEIDEEVQQIFGVDIPENKNEFMKKLSYCFRNMESDNWNEYKDFYHSLMKFRENNNNNGCDIGFSIQPYYMEESAWSGRRSINEFLQLFTMYSQISYYIDFLQFSWGMSTGENNLFSLFARVFDVMKKNSNLKDVIILLDELDASYHPKWQQRVLKSFIDFIQKQCSKTSFQIVLTTHSPVMLSDIPRDNIIFMNNEIENTIEHKQTFAANIATLYYDSFFMDNGSVGEIARSVISRIIDTINDTSEKDIKDDEQRLIYFAKRFAGKIGDINREESIKLVKKVKKIIDNIGEDFWRYKITEQFNDLYLIQDDRHIEKVISEIRKLKETHNKEAVAKLITILEEE